MLKCVVEAKSFLCGYAFFPFLQYNPITPSDLWFIQDCETDIYGNLKFMLKFLFADVEQWLGNEQCA